MSAYVPTVVWVLGIAICFYIAKSRHVKPTLILRLSVVILGPLAIPVVFFKKPEKPVEAS